MRDSCVAESASPDESTVQLYGAPNWQNTRVWAKVNPYVSRDVRTQYPHYVLLRGKPDGPNVSGNVTESYYSPDTSSARGSCKYAEQ